MPMSKENVIKVMLEVYELCISVVFDITAGRNAVAKNKLGSVAAHVKSELRKLDIKVGDRDADDPYTIIGYYEDNSKIFCEHVMATDSNDAIKKLCGNREEKMADDDAKKCSRNNIVIIEIFRGHLESLNDCSTLSNACDWPGLQL